MMFFCNNGKEPVHEKATDPKSLHGGCRSGGK
jgi:hypothetical protein